MKLCLYDQLSFGMAAVYLCLAAVTVRQIASHWQTFQEEARAQSLRLYLYCTLIFASLRSVDFFLSPMLVPCEVHEWQWDLLGEDKSLVIVVLSTLPAALFFVSYSSFAYSTARVYDSLTRSSATRVTRLVLVVLNAAVFCTLVLFWGARELRSKAIASPFDRIAQVTLASASLATSCGFLLSAALTLRFYRNEADAHRAEQVERVVRMARIVVVSVICTCCFALRAIFLLVEIKLVGAAVIVYYLVAEVVTTLAMLYTFSAKGRAPISIRAFFGSASASSSSGAGEYSALKQQTYPADHGVEDDSGSESPTGRAPSRMTYYTRDDSPA
jgi:hypothetical protein